MYRNTCTFIIFLCYLDITLLFDLSVSLCINSCIHFINFYFFNNSFIYLFVRSFIYLFIHLHIYLFVQLFIYLCIYVFIY